MRRSGNVHRYILVVLCFLFGTGLGYLTHPAEPAAVTSASLPAPTVPESTPAARRHHEVARPVTDAGALPAAPAAAAGFPPLPPPGPIREHLDELRERARRGDRAAARRAHRDLQYCAEARHALRYLADAHKTQASCVVERLCTGLQAADLGESGSFLMRAAELGDPDAMAAVADARAINETAAGMRHQAATQALAPSYMRQALQAGSPIAMYTLVVGICMKTDPVMVIPFHRGFPAEERLAWFHAIRPLLQSPQLRDSHLRCSEQWTADAAARAEAHGRALHAQHYAGRDLPESAEARWRRVQTELGRFESQGEDPRWADFPECAG